MIRTWEVGEAVRGLRTDLSMEDAECGRERLVQKLKLALGRVVGKGIPVEPTEEFAARLEAMRVRMIDQDGKELASANGAAILGHPLNAVLWLVRDLEKSGARLKAGDLLSLGSFTAPMPPRPDLAVTVRYEGLPGNPHVSVQFQ